MSPRRVSVTQPREWKHSVPTEAADVCVCVAWIMHASPGARGASVQKSASRAWHGAATAAKQAEAGRGFTATQPPFELRQGGKEEKRLHNYILTTPLLINNNGGKFTSPSSLTLPEGIQPLIHQAATLFSVEWNSARWSWFHPSWIWRHPTPGMRSSQRPLVTCTALW